MLLVDAIACALSAARSTRGGLGLPRAVAAVRAGGWKGEQRTEADGELQAAAVWAGRRMEAARPPATAAARQQRRQVMAKVVEAVREAASAGDGTAAGVARVMRVDAEARGALWQAMVRTASAAWEARGGYGDGGAGAAPGGEHSEMSGDEGGRSGDEGEVAAGGAEGDAAADAVVAAAADAAAAAADAAADEAAAAAAAAEDTTGAASDAAGAADAAADEAAAGGDGGGGRVREAERVAAAVAAAAWKSGAERAARREGGGARTPPRPAQQAEGAARNEGDAGVRRAAQMEAAMGVGGDGGVEVVGPAAAEPRQGAQAKRVRWAEGAALLEVRGVDKAPEWDELGRRVRKRSHATVWKTLSRDGADLADRFLEDAASVAVGAGRRGGGGGGSERATEVARIGEAGREWIGRVHVGMMQGQGRRPTRLAPRGVRDEEADRRTHLGNFFAMPRDPWSGRADEAYRAPVIAAMAEVLRQLQERGWADVRRVAQEGVHGRGWQVRMQGGEALEVSRVRLEAHHPLYDPHARVMHAELGRLAEEVSRGRDVRLLCWCREHREERGRCQQCHTEPMAAYIEDEARRMQTERRRKRRREESGGAAEASSSVVRPSAEAAVREDERNAAADRVAAALVAALVAETEATHAEVQEEAAAEAAAESEAEGGEAAAQARKKKRGRQRSNGQRQRARGARVEPGEAAGERC